ncbi:cupin domain-containing protein [Chloroflexota bacterium]
MGTLKQADAPRVTITEGRTRYMTHTANLMMLVIDFDDGPAEPDPPHQHPHEQVTYVAAGEINFFLDGVPTKLGPGDLVAVPPDIPHCIQLLTAHVRLVDTFTPLREDFMA